MTAKEYPRRKYKLVKSETHRNIINMRVKSHKTIAQIALDTNYSERHIKRVLAMYRIFDTPHD
jgi:hypothetical protein